MRQKWSRVGRFISITGRLLITFTPVLFLTFGIYWIVYGGLPDYQGQDNQIFNTKDSPNEPVSVKVGSHVECWQPSSEIEPNNVEGEANGPLCPGVTYSAMANDAFDWYSFDWDGTGTVHIDVSGFASEGQVNLYYQAQANGRLAFDFDQPSGDYNIDYTGTGQSGTYLIMVFSAAPNDQSYTLLVTGPAPIKTAFEKIANRYTVSLGEPISYTISLKNDSESEYASVQVTDTLPVSLDYIDGSLNATSGTFGEAGGVITWTGSIDVGQAVTITFGVNAGDVVGVVVNTAEINIGQGVFTRSATVEVKPFQVYLPCINRSCSPLYADDFSNPASGWPIYEDGYIRFRYTGGEYNITVKRTRWDTAGRPGFQAANYDVSVDVRNLTGVFGSYGLFFGGSADWSGFYTFELLTDGRWILMKYGSGNWTELAGGSSGYIEKGTATNWIRIVRSGSQISAYVNGHHLTTVYDSAYTGSRYLGLYVAAYDQPNVDIYFDNFALYSTSCSPYIENMGNSAGKATETAFNWLSGEDILSGSGIR